MLVAQAIGSAIVTTATFGVALAVMYLVNAFGLLRISADGETLGMDLHEHGISAYPEYVISSVPSPVAMVVHQPEKITMPVRSQMSATEAAR